MIRGARTKSGRVFFVSRASTTSSPTTDNNTGNATAPGTEGNGWYSFNDRGVHFIGLVNVLGLKAGGLGNLGPEQLDWLKRDVARLSASTPIVVFAHVPLWAVYPTWGWGTDDGTQALALLSRFGSVTVLNGHIHQVVQKVEGHMTFHTALSTAFPQPSPGTAQAPGPVTVDAPELRHYLGLSTVTYLERPGSLAVVDSALEGAHSHRGDRRGRQHHGASHRSGDHSGRSGRDRQLQLLSARAARRSRHDGSLGQPRRHPAPDRKRRRQIPPLPGARHQSGIQLQVHHAQARTSSSAPSTQQCKAWSS